MGLAINWQQQSNIWISLTYVTLTHVTVISLTMPLLLLLWYDIRVEISMKKMVNNKRLISSYIYMHADVILEHLLWTMHNGSFKLPRFTSFVPWFQIKTPQQNQMAQNQPSSLKFIFQRHSPNVYSRLHSGHYASLYKVMQTEKAK